MGCPVENNACEKESFFAFLNKKKFLFTDVGGVSAKLIKEMEFS